MPVNFETQPTSRPAEKDATSSYSLNVGRTAVANAETSLFPDNNLEEHSSPEVREKEELEEFLPREQAREIIECAMSQRTDENGVLLPLEELRYSFDSRGERRIPHDDMVFAPSSYERRIQENGKDTLRTFDGGTPALYESFTKRERVEFSPNEIGAAEISRDRLGRLLQIHPELSGGLSDEQSEAAMHVRNENSREDGSLAEGETRIYVDGGINASEVMLRALELGADVEYIKAWMPQLKSGPQIFRRDTPIFRVENADQLRSVTDILRYMHEEEGFSFGSADTSPVGLEVPQLPGVFIGQNEKGSSFNSEMAGVMGSGFFVGPTKEACNSVPIRAGEEVTQEWTDEAAAKLQAMSYEAAAEHGRNSRCHALLAEQDERVIYNAIQPHSN